jgi:hypothetical protein
MGTQIADILHGNKRDMATQIAEILREDKREMVTLGNDLLCVCM